MSCWWGETRFFIFFLPRQQRENFLLKFRWILNKHLIFSVVKKLFFAFLFHSKTIHDTHLDCLRKKQHSLFNLIIVVFIFFLANFSLFKNLIWESCDRQSKALSFFTTKTLISSWFFLFFSFTFLCLILYKIKLSCFMQF
jgi:hypothetical protein